MTRKNVDSKNEISEHRISIVTKTDQYGNVVMMLYDAHGNKIDLGQTKISAINFYTPNDGGVMEATLTFSGVNLGRTEAD